MNICIIGINLTSLILSKLLINNGLLVSIFSFNDNKYNLSSRTIGISRDNINFINNKIINLKKKNLCKIKNIKIYTDDRKEILNFKNKTDNLFSIIELNKFYNILYNDLKNKKSFNIKKVKEKNFNKIFNGTKYDLVINCEKNNFITRKYFSKTIKKNYNSIAHTCLIYHQKIKNFVASQYFTNLGPIAFLPISSKTTSIVFSSYKKKRLDDKKFEKFIFSYSNKLKINKFSKISRVNLNFSSARRYYSNNVLLFGDSLHQIHPLAGQGFNMTIRDLKVLSSLIENKKNLGLTIDSTLLKDFEEETKSKNLIFSFGVNLIQNFFEIKKELGIKKIDHLIRYLGKKNFANNFLLNAADKGL